MCPSHLSLFSGQCLKTISFLSLICSFTCCYFVLKEFLAVRQKVKMYKHLSNLTEVCIQTGQEENVTYTQNIFSVNISKSLNIIKNKPSQ